MNPDLFESYLSRLFDRDLSVEEFAELEQYLSTSAEARVAYLDYVDFHSAMGLEHSVATQPHLGSASIIPVDKIIRRQRRKTLRFAAIAAAALVLVSISILSFFQTEGNGPPLAFKFAPSTEYSVTHPVGLEKDPEGLVLLKGSNLKISQGTIELTFKSGVKSILQAPANVTLHADDTLYMHEGTAWFHVPSGAEGFTVNTSDLHVVDLGTEFGVIAKPKNHDEIHVFEGKVQVLARVHKKESATLSKGDARRIDPAGRLSTIPSESKVFIKELPSTLPYVHWSFDNVVAGKFKAEGNHPELELASAKSPRVNIKSLRTKGRFGSGVRFTGIKGQELHTQLSGVEGDAPRTTACWVRTKYIPHLKGGKDLAGLIGWGYCVDDNKKVRSNKIWKHSVSSAGTTACSGAGYYAGQTNVADGKWHHLACVMKPSEVAGGPPEVILYVDGKAEKSINPNDFLTPNTLTKRPDSTPIRIGCSIHKPNTAPIVFRGEIDEMYLFYGALDEAAIQNLMRTNNPNR